MKINVDPTSKKIKDYNYDITIVGAGISGLYCALKSSRKGLKVAIVLKSTLGDSNTKYAQGGVAVVWPTNTSDSVDLHIKDTLNAGAGLSDKSIAKIISEKSYQVIKYLIENGVPFDRMEDNNLAMTMEGAHSVRRILHSGGDSTGKNIENSLIQLVKNEPNIDIYENNQLVDLLISENNTCHGIISYNSTSCDHQVFVSKHTVIATGGLAQVYLNTTNPTIATGDGVAIAFNAGAKVQDMEFIQFHPTAFFSNNNEPKFLISESVRGEGAKLRNIHKELFAYKYDDREDLAPRDIVTRAIFTEMIEHKSEFVYLDATKIPKEKLKKRFPNIMNVCMEHGIDISEDLIPVSPSAHYSMGGIAVDSDGKSNINNLYAIGEVACTSLHGANRLASNSLLECLVMANNVSKGFSIELYDASEIYQSKKIKEKIALYLTEKASLKIEELSSLLIRLKTAMWQYAGIIKNKDQLKKCLEIIEELQETFGEKIKCNSVQEYELRNLLTIARIIVTVSIKRKESRGSHFRDDYLERSPQASHSILVKSEEDEKYEIFTSQSNIKRLHSIHS